MTMMACIWCLKPMAEKPGNVQLVLRSRDKVFLHGGCLADAVEKSLKALGRRDTERAQDLRLEAF